MSLGMFSVFIYSNKGSSETEHRLKRELFRLICPGSVRLRRGRRARTHTATRSIAFLSSVNNGSGGSRMTLITAANSASSTTHHPPNSRSCHRLSLPSEGFQRTHARTHTHFSLSGTKNDIFYSLRAALTHHTRHPSTTCHV